MNVRLVGLSRNASWGSTLLRSCRVSFNVNMGSRISCESWSRHLRVRVLTAPGASCLFTVTSDCAWLEKSNQLQKLIATMIAIIEFCIVTPLGFQERQAIPAIPNRLPFILTVRGRSTRRGIVTITVQVLARVRTCYTYNEFSYTQQRGVDITLLLSKSCLTLY